MRHGFDTSYKYHLLAIIAICLLTTLLYARILDAPFVFDDIPDIRENHYLRWNDFNLKNVSDVIFKIRGSNRPIANLSFAVNHYLGGYAVAGYHVINIVIHVINGILVYFLTSMILTQTSLLPNQKTMTFSTNTRRLISTFAALLFVSHPVQTQAVTYVVQRMTSMAVMFSLLSFFLYIQGRLHRSALKRGILFAGCLVSWIMSLGSKEIAGILPLLILTYEWYFFQDLQLPWLRRSIKYGVGLAVILGVLVFIYLGESPIDRIFAGYAARDFTMAERVLTQFRVVVFYISLSLFPHPSRLNLMHYVSTSHSFLEPVTTLLAFLILLGLGILAVCIAKRHRLISFGILWFFITLALESSILGLDLIFEHRLYFPMFGLVIIAGSLFFHFFSTKRLPAMTASVLIILSVSSGTYLRNGVWESAESLWMDVLSKNPRSFKAYTNLGKVLARKGHIDKAIEHYRAGLDINPNYIVAHHNLGLALVEKGLIDEAVNHYLAALRIKPDYGDANASLGLALYKKGRTKEAIERYLKALRNTPHNAKAHNNLGVALGRQGRTAEALQHFSRALQIDPDYAEAHNNLGIILFRKRDMDGSINHFRQALRIKPDYPEARRNLQAVLRERHQQRGN